jgi:beta-lactamase superfamily II metal-dependent hydrolase
MNHALRHPFVTDTEAAFVHQLRPSLALISTGNQAFHRWLSAMFNAAFAEY